MPRRSSSATSSIARPSQTIGRSGRSTDLRRDGRIRRAARAAPDAGVRPSPPTTPPRSSSPRARPPIPRAWSSPTATSSRTSSRSSTRSRNTAATCGPFLPIRFLNLLPLSHMFGQAMATFIPPMLPGLVVFTRSYAPEDIVRQIRRAGSRCWSACRRSSRCCGITSLRLHPETAVDPPAGMHWARRWWHYRRVHRALRAEVLGLRRRRGAARPGARDVLGPARVRRRPGLRPDGDGADRHAQPPAARRRRGPSASPSPASRSRSPTTARSSCAATTSRAATSTRRKRRVRRSRTAGSTPATSASSTRAASCTSAAARRR